MAVIFIIKLLQLLNELEILICHNCNILIDLGVRGMADKIWNYT